MDREVDCDSSGLPFDDTEIRMVDPDANGVGEIVTRHRGLFKGYFGDAAATAETLTRGRLAAHRRCRLPRRARAGWTSSTGSRTSPAPRRACASRPQFIENKLKFSPYIGECVVLGDGRPCLAAILCIRYSMVGKWAEAQRHRLHHLSEPGRASGRCCELLAGEVEKVNASLPEPQRIRRFVLLYKELDADDGELTRTRKVRRRVIDERYAAHHRGDLCRPRRGSISRPR